MSKTEDKLLKNPNNEDDITEKDNKIEETEVVRLFDSIIAPFFIKSDELLTLYIVWRS